MSYDPLSSAFPVDVTISAQAYIVTAFSDAGNSAVEVNFQTSAGAWRGRRLAAGERTASMTIECENAAEANPAQFATFNYQGETWVIKQVAKAISSTAPGAWTLTLGWVSVAA
jgi:hypothetical protein